MKVRELPTTAIFTDGIKRKLYYRGKLFFCKRCRSQHTFEDGCESPSPKTHELPKAREDSAFNIQEGEGKQVQVPRQREIQKEDTKKEYGGDDRSLNKTDIQAKKQVREKKTNLHKTLVTIQRKTLKHHI